MHHDSAESAKALSLLRTARGQLDAVINMTLDDRYCVDISKQILAVQALLRKSNHIILRQHLDTCVRDAVNDNKADEKMNEIMTILDSYIG